MFYIQSTDGSVSKYIEKGFWPRQKYVLEEYAKEFSVYYYTSDLINFQYDMPEGVIHKTLRIKSKIYGLHHILFYVFLIKESLFWEKNNIIRVWGTSLPVLGIIKFLSRCSLVISFQYDWASGTKKDYKGIKPLISEFVQYLALKSATSVICTMGWLEDLARKKYKKNKVYVIPNFVNIQIFKPLPIKKNQIVFAGRLHWSKGVDTLIRAFKVFKEENPDWKLIILGDGEEKNQLMDLGKDIDSILFTGKVNYTQVAENFNSSKIFVLPTKTMEGHPKAMVEAMAAGCVVVASRVPGNADVLIEAKTENLLFEAGDTSDLLRKLRLAKDFNPSVHLNFALDNYSSNTVIKKEVSILKDSLSR